MVPIADADIHVPVAQRAWKVSLTRSVQKQIHHNFPDTCRQPQNHSWPHLRLPKTFPHHQLEFLCSKVLISNYKFTFSYLYEVLKKKKEKPKTLWKVYPKIKEYI